MNQCFERVSSLADALSATAVCDFASYHIPMEHIMQSTFPIKLLEFHQQSIYGESHHALSTTESILCALKAMQCNIKEM